MMDRISWLALAAALGGLAPTHVLAQDAVPRFSVQLQGSDRLGAAGNLFVPFVFGDGQVVFADGWLDYQADGRFGASVGLGARQDVGGLVLGANAYLDFLHSAEGESYQQIAAGIEALSRHWEFRANAYLPVGDTSHENDAFSTTGIADGHFVYSQGYEVALYAVDAEVGLRLPVFADDDPAYWKLYAGVFSRGSEMTDTVTGLALRTELNLPLQAATWSGSSLAFGAGLRFDSNEDLSANAYLRLTVPLGGGAPVAPQTANPLLQAVERDRIIQLDSGAFGAQQQAFADNGSSHVLQISAADGAAAALNAKLAAAGEGAIVLASGDITLDESLELVANQMLVGGGGIVDLTTADGKAASYVNPGAGTTLIGQGGGAGLSAMLAAPAWLDVLVLADGSTVSTLSIVGGDNAIVARGVDGITVKDVAIRGVSGNGIVLDTVADATIAGVSIKNTYICEISAMCEYSIFDPDYVPNAAINAVGVTGLTISDVDITDVTYGIFIAPDIEQEDWENVAVTEARDISIDDVTITNSRREGLMIVGASGVAIDGLDIDNSALDRDMDLVVFQTSHDITLSNATLRGGVNALMFAYYFGIPGENPNAIAVSNVQIADTARAGIFLNPSWDVSFTDVSIANAGTYGVYFYGDAWGYMGGPVHDIRFDGVTVTDPAAAGFYLAGPVENIDGDIALVGGSTCAADFGAWSGTTITQDAGFAFTVNGAEVTEAWLAEQCPDTPSF